MLRSDIDPLLLQKIQQDLLSHCSKISGDDPVTVSAIAKKAGLENADKYIDATTITTPEDMLIAEMYLKQGTSNI